MSLQPINVGAVANDHTGDSLRTALQKANQPLYYSFGTNNWGNTDWKAAMTDYISNNTPPGYWVIDPSTGNLSYPTGSPVIEISPVNGSIAFKDASTLTPDGSGHLLISDQIAAGPGLTAWDRYPYECGIVANNTTMGAKLGIYSMVTTTDPATGGNASMTFGLPNAGLTTGINAFDPGLFPGFEIQFLSDATYSNNEMRWNYIERDPSTGNVTEYNANIFEVFGDGHMHMQGPVTVANPIIATSGVATSTGGPVSIALTGSPTTWTNTTGVNVFVMIGGGVTTDVGLNGGGLFTGVSLTGVTTLPLQPGESFYIYYTSDPTIYYKPF